MDINMQNEHEHSASPWTHSLIWACSMVTDMQHGHGHAAWTFGMGMDMQHEHGQWGESILKTRVAAPCDLLISKFQTFYCAKTIHTKHTIFFKEHFWVNNM
jgi:hypothetical protein